jgi:cysteine dioxygenase
MTLAFAHGPSARTSDRLRRLISELVRSHRALSTHELACLVARAGLTREDLAPFVETQEADYAHRELFRSPHVELGCIGWRRGHQTPIHDHHDSACCVLVLEGILTNTAYRPLGGGTAVRGETRRLRAGDILALEGTSVHRMKNEQHADLVTLHVYSPPLLPMHARIKVESTSERDRSAGGRP